MSYVDDCYEDEPDPADFEEPERCPVCGELGCSSEECEDAQERKETDESLRYWGLGVR